jgi:type I restriction enzyme S subunit
MNNWKEMELGKAIQFNPTERISKGKIAKKIPMDRLTAYEKKIKGFEFAEYSAGPKFRNGDTLVAKITPCLENGKTAQVDILENNEVAFGSSEFIVLRENENTINDFIFYLAKSPAFRKRAIGCMEGTSGRKRVNEGALKLQVLPIPNKPTQQKIASVLSALDSKIELNNRINAELEAMAKTLYDYWFVQFDFPDKNGKPYKTSGGKMVWNEELKRKIPEGWEVNKIDYFCRIFTGKKDVNQSLDSGKYKFFSCSPNYKFSNDKLYEGKAILISGNGSYTGRTIFVDEGFDLYQRTYACVNNTETDILPYLYFSILRFLSLKIGGGTHGSAIPYIVYDDIAKDTFSYNFEVVSKFQKIINPILSNIKSTDIQTINLTELRDWLLPMLMNGQVNVKEEKETELSMAAEPKMKYGK